MKKIILMSAILSCLLFAACSSYEREVHFIDAGSYMFKRGASYIIDSTDDLSEYVSDTFNDFDEAVVAYDSAYFEDSAIVIVEMSQPSGSYTMTMSSVKIKNGIMVVKINTKKPDIHTDDIKEWHIIIECTQDEADSIKSVEVYENGERVKVNYH